jgi:pimeloyl-ACP methyl ester carboxylesterase
MTVFVTANGLEIGYDVHGAGPPMVMLHGASSAGREDYAAQTPLFSRAFRVHLPDARGHATTRWDASSGLSQEDLLADLLGFADALRLSTFHLVGFSLGAMTALRFAIRHPGRLRTLVVIGVSTDREPRISVARRILDPRRIEHDDPAWAAELGRRHDASQGAGAWQRLLDAVVADVAGQAEITPGDLRRVDLPSLVVCGDRDPFTPVGQAWGLARQLPDARLFVAPGCGHDVMVRRPALFNEALGSFYRSTEEVARRRAAAGTAAGLAAAAAAGTGAPGSEAGSRTTGARVDSVLVDGTLAHPAGGPGPETDGEWLAHTGDGSQEAGQ